LRPWLYREILINALKFKRDELDILDLKIANRAMAEFRYAAKVFKPYRKFRKVSIFGSARVPEDAPYYQLAEEFSRFLAGQDFMVITGAAQGIMKAGIEGVGTENSFGVNILLPFESTSTILENDPKLINFRYFFSKEDLSFYKIVHSSEEAAAWIKSYYSTYHSSRQVGEKLVIRLEQELSDEGVTALNESFSDLVVSGEIVKTTALPQEKDEPELLSKPRISFRTDNHSAGRLNQMILAINGMEHET